MGLTAIVTDPRTEPPPPRWDEFVAAHPRLQPGWHSSLLQAVDWCVPDASSTVLVAEASSGQPVAAFHVRHVSPLRRHQLSRPGRVPPFGVTSCRLAPLPDAGVAFAAEAGLSDQVEAVRVFAHALRRRAGPAGRVVIYRRLPDQTLPAVPHRDRLRRARMPQMVVHNEWSDVSGYLAGLSKVARRNLRWVRRQVDRDETIRVSLASRIEPPSACWLAESVRQSHGPGSSYPPCPAHYFTQLNLLPGTYFLTYRDPAGRLLAYLAGHDDGDQIFAGLWGRRGEADGGRPYLFFDMILRSVELMVARGRRRLVLGGALPEVKARYGAWPEPRWDLVRLG